MIPRRVSIRAMVIDFHIRRRIAILGLGEGVDLRAGTIFYFFQFFDTIP